jgi:hypothetical protein
MSKKNQENVIDIGRFVRVPTHVRRSGVSPRAQQIWLEVALNSSPEKPYAYIRQGTAAAALNISTDTVGRALKELVQAGLLVETGRYFCGRYKFYIVMWTAHTLENLPQFPETNPWAQVEPAPVRLPKPAPQKAPHVIRVLEDQKKSTYYTAPQPRPAEQPKPEPRATVQPPIGQRPSGETLLQSYETEWKEKFKSLDGHSGRPSVRDCVVEAMNHTARHKYDDLKIYLENWLRNAALRFKQDYEREEALHWSDPRLDAPVRAQKQALEEQRRKEFEERARIRFEEEMSKKPEPTKEELRARDVFLASVRRHEAMEARRAANYRRVA